MLAPGWRPTALAALRQADWLTAERARIYSRMVAVMIALQALSLVGKIVWTAHADPAWRPLPTDFDAFWSGARLALAGHPALAYDTDAMLAAQRIGAQPAPGQFFPYLYPPVFLLLSLPLGLLPYLAAMAAFSLGGYAAIVACLRQILPRAWPLLPVLAFPPAMMNATMGQNGALSALCFTGGLLQLERRPALAGACLGLLVFKPHLAVPVPVALLAARRWRALFACAATAAALCLLSWAALGSTTWQGFLAAGPMARAVLTGDDTWPRMLSVYAAVRLLQGSLPAGILAQAVAAAAALASVAWVCRRRPGAGAESAVTVTAALLCTPYLFDYDLVCLGVPMAWIAGSGSVRGWRAWEKLLLCALLLFPLEARNCNAHLGLPLTPFLVALLLACVIARARHAPAQPVTAAQPQPLALAHD
jgi:hypothetical protein